jgi:hypothetical protein
MNREVHVRICERLGVKFPGPTRHSLPIGDLGGMSANPPIATVSLRRGKRRSEANHVVSALQKKREHFAVGVPRNWSRTRRLGVIFLVAAVDTPRRRKKLFFELRQWLPRMRCERRGI